VHEQTDKNALKIRTV